jgi:OmpA-OmpF porin, OOP family
MNTWKTVAGVLLASGGLAVTQAHAQEKFYVGASAGKSDIDRSVAEGFISSGSVDGKDSGSKIFGGYRFGTNFALELAYVDLGNASYSGDFFGASVANGKVKVSGFNTSAVALWPINPSFELFGKAGAFAWEARASDMTGGVPFSAKWDDVTLSLGLGVNYHFSKNVAARLEWEHFDLDPDKASMLSAGLLVKF